MLTTETESIDINCRDAFDDKGPFVTSSIACIAFPCFLSCSVRMCSHGCVSLDVSCDCGLAQDDRH